ncbi:toll-like receptor 2 type-2 [Schistocerca gregaria]|uniref:toll-like receptor 2 type-2 n=1 Tax=Schistocerca gregaria TaxID=7010 RepID=UPI00211DAAC6|nr:toll-like receptor 2 type-2 [Schistocerca gregaria]
MAATWVPPLALALIILPASAAGEIRYKEIDIGSLTCDEMKDVEPLEGCRFAFVNGTEQQVSCKLVVKQKQENDNVLSFRKIMLNTMNFRILGALSSDQHAYCASIASIHLQISDNDVTESHTETDLPPGFITFLNFFTNDSFAHIDFTKDVPVATVTLSPECQGLPRKDLRAECADKVLFLKEIKRGTFNLDFNGDHFWSFLKRRFVENLGAELTQLSITKSDRLSLVPLQFITRVLSPELRMKELTAARMPLGEVRQPLVAMPTLQVLRLPGDGITKLGAAALQSVPELKELDLSANELEELPQSLPGGLEILNVAYNRLSALTTLSASLLNLNVSNNNIATLPEPLPAGLETLDASHNRLQRLPQGLPAGLQLLSLSHNQLRVLPDKLPPKLQVLQVSNNQLQTLSPQLLVPLQQLQVLDVSHNELSTADGLWLSHQLRLLNISHNALLHLRLLGPGNASHIDASYNRIESWKVRAGHLTLVGNARSPLGLQFLRADDSGMTIDLGDNMLLSCDPCSSDAEVTRQLRQWMEKQRNTSSDRLRVVRPEQPVCSEPQERAGKPVERMKDLDDRSGCPGSPRYVAQFLVLLISLLAVIVAITLLCYHRRYEITYVCHLMKMRRERVAAERRHPSSYKYDAFVCYSSADRAWVVGQLLPKLEHAGDSPDDPALRLCLHERDFPLGSFIADNIVSSMKDSRSTVIVLSQAFVDSQWCRWELEVASNKVHHLVLLELERMNRSRLPRNLRYLMDTRTYLEWPAQRRAQEAKWRQLRAVLAAPGAPSSAVADAGDDARAAAPGASEQPQQSGSLKEHPV